ncbi:ATP-grasp domain-containing protein [Sphingobacterium chuzhouense]|uniref:ATP-grasp domain-containing protein n=1 Tax=Sphingobacterium chuzhouense TaxID=1742264 RepID=A0ABR7XXN8_9SPHI|nr:hypothetical protein [Sphingobacterium chuzhouense]MBD1423801.1 hypothetical protein [Sphingobacterium chuzhouense]
MNKSLKIFLGYYFSFFSLREKKNIQKYRDVLAYKEQHFDESPVMIGILKEKWGLHALYVKACLEQRISFKVIDIFSVNWREGIYDKELDFIVYRPSVQYSPWKDMFDNRIRLFASNKTTPVFPSPTSTWLWENKLRTLEWLAIHKVSYPTTYIYYDKNELLNNIGEISFPIVYKSSMGSGASGVKILKNRHSLSKMIDKSFSKGIRTYKKNLLDKEHGYIILQEFIPKVREWRIIRIGDYYFAFQKIAEGEYHSGSQKFGYGMPPLDCLELVRDLGNTYDFKYVAIDIFIDQHNKLYVNEIQPYFGQKDDRELLLVEGRSGRLFYNTGEWKFEEGQFCQNNLCNLRISEFIKEYKSRSLVEDVDNGSCYE